MTKEPEDTIARAPHVVLVGLHYAPEHSGNAPYTTGLARHLASVGMRVTVITGYPHYPEWSIYPGYVQRRPHETDLGVNIIRIRHPIPTRPTALSRVLMEAVFAAKAGISLRRAKPDLVIAVSPVLLSVLPAVLMRRLYRYRLGLLIQDLYGAALSETGVAPGRAARAVAQLEAALFSRADSVVVIHEVFYKRLVSEGLMGDRIRVIPNWTHVKAPQHSEVRALRERLGWGDNEVIALHAGNMGLKQGLEGLIDTARLAEQKGSRVRIVLLGDGSRRSTLESYGSGATRLSMIQPLPEGDFEGALAAADCLLLHEMPGVVEMSVPSKLTSYFSAGRPVVAATHADSGAAALISAADAGIRVPAGKPDRILDAIESLASNAPRADALGENGRRFAEEHLTAKGSLSAYEEWVRELLSGNGHSTPLST